jgi:nitroreductase
VIDILRTRRSIRRYEAKPIDPGSLEILKEALLRSPSSRGLNPWTFIFVDKPDLLAQLAKAKEHGSNFLKGAALGIVVCGDETVSDVWVEDASVASLVAHLTAHSLDLGSCWVQVRNREHSKDQTAEQYVQALLDIPAHIKVEAIIAIGYPAETKKPVPDGQLDYGKIQINGYPK